MEAGWRRAASTTLATPSPDDPTVSAATVSSYVDDYASASGASDAFALFNNPSAFTTVDVELVRGGPTLGDESRTFRIRGTATDTGAPFQASALSFRVGNLEAGVAFYDWGNRPVPTGTIDALAARLLDRVGAGRMVEGGLSVAALELFGEDVTDLDDEYLRLDGQTFPFSGETVEAAAALLPDAARDVYLHRQSIGGGDPAQPGLYAVYLFRFPEEADADAWLAAARERVGVYAADLPFGDEAFAYSYAPPASDAAARRGYVGYARIGRIGMSLELGASPEAPLAAFQALARSQLRCLEEGECLASPRVPSALTGTLADAATAAAATPSAAATPTP